MQTGSPPAAQLDIWAYLQVARRRWAVIVLLGLLVPALSLLFSLRREARYAASSEVLVKRQNLAASLTPGQAPFTDGPTAERMIETQVQLARVPDLADRVIGAAGLAGTYTAGDLLESSTVTAKAKTDILVFRVEWAVPQQARALARSYAELFTTYRRELDSTELAGLADGVRAQLDGISSPEGRTTPLYVDLQDKLRQIQTLQALQTSSAVVVRRPDSTVKVGPTSATLVAGGLLLGLMLGGGLVFLLESLDTRVRRSSEVEAILGIPLLTRLPAPPAHLQKRSALVVLEEPDSPAAEAFAFLRTNLMFANVGSEAKTIMFCSAVEQEGKSTTICNLAVALARSGSRVILVDLDYRRPTVHSLFGVSRSPGVTEVSNGSGPVDDALRPVRIASGTDVLADVEVDQGLLQVLPAGASTHRINVDAVVAVLDRLRGRADVVLVDAPPLLLVGEALALSAKMDALVVVARLNHVRKPLLEELRSAFDAAPVRPLGFVATAAAEEPGYSHYFGKSYGYASDDAAPSPSSARGASPPPPVNPAAGSESPPPPAPVEAPVQAPSPAVEVAETAPAEYPAPAGPQPRESLLKAVFADGGETTDTTRRPDALPVVGVQPRRSWSKSTLSPPSPAPESIDEAEAQNGVSSSTSDNRTSGEGGGAPE